LPNLAETFVLALQKTRDKANGHIREYRLHGDLTRVWGEVAGTYGELMKFGAYLLGHLHGHNAAIDAAPAAREALQEHWFGPYIARLDEALTSLWAKYANWTDRTEFEPLGTSSATLSRWAAYR
jgi:hypothetical protein